MKVETVAAVVGFSLAVLAITVLIWGFSNMGDCLPDMVCVRAWWLDPVIFGSAALAWLFGMYRILRKQN